MSARLLLVICKALLLARFKQTLVAAVGVTFGITTFISLVSFMTGFNKFLNDLILNRTPHVLLYNEIKPSKNQPIDLVSEFNADTNFVLSVKPRNVHQEIRNSLAIIKVLKGYKDVFGVAPKINAPVFYNAGSIDISGVLYGIDVPHEEKLFAFSDYIIKGKSRNLTIVANSIILGKGVAEKMMADIGDNVQVTGAQGKRVSLKVVGIFQLGVADVDAVQSYASLESVQNLLGKTSSYITDIQIKLYNLEDSPAFAKKFSKVFETDAKDIITSNAQFETGSSIRNIITYSVSITLLVVAGFGIYNILNMMIYEKMDTIAIMKATGFSRKDVRIIFLTLSMIIGIAGGIAGLLLGFTGSVLIDNIPFETNSLPTLKTFPVIYNPLFYVIGITFALFTTYIAGYFPARRAGKVDPVVIIRGK